MADVEVRQAGEGITLVELNRPEKMNAIRQSMWRALGNIFEALSADEAVRVVILSGAGGHFSAGADIAEFATVRKDAATGARYTADVDRAIHAIAAAPKPVIAAISGNAIGGGLELALACDFRVAEANARGGITAAQRGIVYGIEACRMLADAVGKVMAKRILFTGEHIHAEEGYRIGLFDRLAEDSALAEAIAYAETLKAAAPLSLRGAKMALEAIAAGTVESVREAHEALAVTALESEDYREATRAFREKRRPVFTGR